MIDVDNCLQIGSLLRPLPPRYQDIILRYYGIGCPKQNMSEIAAVYEVSHERIRQIRSKAIRQMRFISEHGAKKFEARHATGRLKIYHSETNRVRP